MPAGVRSPAAFVMPGCLSWRYIRSSKLTRLRLNAVVSALARLLATTSMRVDSALRPVAAECKAVIAMKPLSDAGARRLEGGPPSRAMARRLGSDDLIQARRAG